MSRSLTVPSRPVRVASETGRFGSMTGEAQQRTRTADPFLTMEVLYQLS